LIVKQKENKEAALLTLGGAKAKKIFLGFLKF